MCNFTKCHGLWKPKVKLVCVVFDMDDTQPNNVVSKPSDIRDDISTVSLMTVNDVGDGAHLKYQQDNLIKMQ